MNYGKCPKCKEKCAPLQPNGKVSRHHQTIVISEGVGWRRRVASFDRKSCTYRGMPVKNSFRTEATRKFGIKKLPSRHVFA